MITAIIPHEAHSLPTDAGNAVSNDSKDWKREGVNAEFFAAAVNIHKMIRHFYWATS